MHQEADALAGKQVLLKPSLAVVRSNRPRPRHATTTTSPAFSLPGRDAGRAPQESPDTSTHIPL
jgi:hypothetical protein